MGLIFRGRGGGTSWAGRWRWLTTWTMDPRIPSNNNNNKLFFFSHRVIAQQQSHHHRLTTTFFYLVFIIFYSCVLASCPCMYACMYAMATTTPTVASRWQQWLRVKGEGGEMYITQDSLQYYHHYHHYHHTSLCTLTPLTTLYTFELYIIILFGSQY